MEKFIFAKRARSHIFDLAQTVEATENAKKYLSEASSNGAQVLMVGTKKQASDTIVSEAQRSGSFYITTRWLGGTLTNFKTIQSRIDYMVQLETRKARGEFAVLPKKESLKLEESIVRLNRYLGGIKEMTEMPGALFVIDVGKEAIAVAEARNLNIPLVAVIDSNSNPDGIDYPIPGNDDSLRAIALYCTMLSEAVIDGLQEEMMPTGGDAGEAAEPPVESLPVEGAVIEGAAAAGEGATPAPAADAAETTDAAGTGDGDAAEAEAAKAESAVDAEAASAETGETDAAATADPAAADAAKV